MSLNLNQSDYNVLKQRFIKKFIKINLLDFKYNIVDEISGNCIAASINEDANSDLRRSCSVSLVVTDSSFDIKSGGKIWLDKFIQLYVGYENSRTKEIQWYAQGIFLINSPTWVYDGATNELSFSALDLMSKLTGVRNGQLEGIPTTIAKDENVRKAIIKTLELGGFTKYVCDECYTTDDNGKQVIQAVPYDITIDQGGTVYDILCKLRDIIPQYEIYFDVDGVFHYEMIPSGDDEPIVLDDDLLKRIVTSEQIDTDFESVKNYVEIWGHTWDIKYYSDKATTTVENGVIIPTYPEINGLAENTVIGFVLTDDVTYESGLSIRLIQDRKIVDYAGEPVKSLTKDEIWIFRFKADLTWEYMGHEQAQAISYDDNPESPFYVGNPIGSSSVGRIRIVLYGGEYDNIYSDNLAKQRADFEIYQRCRLQDSISLSMIPIPWLKTHVLINYSPKGSSVPEKYLIKSISTDYSASGAMSINAIKYYPYYPNGN